MVHDNLIDCSNCTTCIKSTDDLYQEFPHNVNLASCNVGDILQPDSNINQSGHQLKFASLIVNEIRQRGDVTRNNHGDVSQNNLEFENIDNENDKAILINYLTCLLQQLF